MTHTTDTVVYANVKVTLRLRSAEHALATVVDAAGTPDAIGLGEWPKSRVGILREFPEYDWRRPILGGGPIGLHRDRYRVHRIRARMLVGVSHVEPDPGNERRILGPSWCTEVLAWDRDLGEHTAWLLYHLTAGIQGPGGVLKRDTHPRRVRRHDREADALDALVSQHQHAGRTVYALGDSNEDGFTVTGLTSAWGGHNDAAGGDLGPRRISDVFGPGDARTQLVKDGSDHQAVIATRVRHTR